MKTIEITKQGFTLVEVSILFVIFITVAFLVAPLSLNDTIQARNTSKWRSVQNDFINIFNSINTQREEENDKPFEFEKALSNVLSDEIIGNHSNYRITFMNGAYPNNTYRFPNYKETIGKATISIKFNNDSNNPLKGILMYDVNGNKKPNVWGKDVFGYNIYEDRFEPFCKNEPVSKQKEDCSRNGTGLCCSNYYLIGGNFD